MPARSNQTRGVLHTQWGPLEILQLDMSYAWRNSPRRDGKLVLQDNDHGRVAYGRTLGTVNSALGSLRMPTRPLNEVAVLPDFSRCLTALENESYAKFRGKLYRGNASLGVTLGSWKQSRDMIVRRYQSLTARADKWWSILRKQSRSKQVAGFHLEVIFGWVPLLADIHSATTTVIQDRIPPQFVKSRSDGFYRGSRRDGNSSIYTITDYEGRIRVTQSATAYIANPNTWLAERAGLLNPLAVAWDLVPWSFVVNMFVNTGQLVNAVTDFAGLRFSQSSTTRNIEFRYDYKSHRQGFGIDCQFSGWGFPKSRTLGLTPPSLQFKLPEVNWESAAMAASLFTQKFRRINALF